MSGYLWPLMTKAISLETKAELCQFIMDTDDFTQGKVVNAFEYRWDEFYQNSFQSSLMVNSGSSANLLLLAAIKEWDSDYEGCVVFANAVTWSTNIAPIIQLGYQLQLCDIDLHTLGINYEAFEKLLKQFPKHKKKLLFATHVLGFNCITKDILYLCREYNVSILEDRCEATGIRTNSDMTLGSTYSFYYGHHMTSIEGGLVTFSGDKDLYEIGRMMRSHGLTREINDDNIFGHYRNADVDPQFDFAVPGFNLRSTEINATLALAALKDINNNINRRNRRWELFRSHLDENKYHTDFTKDVSSFAFPIITKLNNKEAIEDTLYHHSIQFRPLISGNMYRQSLVQSINMFRTDDMAEYVHLNGLYIGNHDGVTNEMILAIAEALNNV